MGDGRGIVYNKVSMRRVCNIRCCVVGSIIIIIIFFITIISCFFSFFVCFIYKLLYIVNQRNKLCSVVRENHYGALWFGVIGYVLYLVFVLFPPSFCFIRFTGKDGFRACYCCVRSSGPCCWYGRGGQGYVR